MIKECKKHGLTEHFQRVNTSYFRCGKCASESVIKRRKAKKLLLVAKFGGKCSICGYSKCIASLEFHHINPSEKSFALSTVNNVSFERMEEEAKKCILICANCHAELHYNQNTY